MSGIARASVGLEWMAESVCPAFGPVTCHVTPTPGICGRGKGTESNTSTMRVRLAPIGVLGDRAVDDSANTRPEVHLEDVPEAKRRLRHFADNGIKTCVV